MYFLVPSYFIRELCVNGYIYTYVTIDPQENMHIASVKTVIRHSPLNHGQ